MITINPKATLCETSTEAVEALRADKESPAVVIVLDSDEAMLELNAVISKEAATLQSAALRFDRPTEFWQIGNVFPIGEEKWKLLVIRRGLTGEQIAQMKMGAAMQQAAVAAAQGGGGGGNGGPPTPGAFGSGPRRR